MPLTFWQKRGRVQVDLRAVGNDDAGWKSDQAYFFEGRSVIFGR